MNIIETKNLTKKFKDLVAVDNLNISIKEGEIFGLLGPNGAGKTTTVSMLTTLLIPSSGTAKVNGFDIEKNPKKVRESIGLVFQDTIIDKDLTGYDNLDLYSRLYKIPKNERKNRIKKLAKLVQLEDRLKEIVETYSGGMKRQLEIIRGLLHYPKVLFLDEPTLGLDPKARRDIWNYIKEMNKEKGTTIFLTTHYMEEADELCDRIAIMNKGKIVVIGTPQKLKDSLGGDIIEVKINKSANGLIEKLKKVKFIKDAKATNKTLKITLEHGETKIEDVIQTIKKQGYNISSIELHKPTLEDVFLYYTGEEFERNG